MNTGLSLANLCCMCCCNKETVECGPPLSSLSCNSFFVASNFWDSMGHARFCSELFFCWCQWAGKHNSNIWHLFPGCLRWMIWTERNHRSFEDIEKLLGQLQDLCQQTLFDRSWCWGILDCSSIIEFISSLRIVSWFFCFFAFCCLFIVHHCEHLYSSFFFFLIILLLLSIQKKEEKFGCSVEIESMV